MTKDHRDNLFNLLLSKFLPFWPLFFVLIIIGGVAVKLYLSTTTPLYQSYAALIVNDEKKGVDESQLMESFNVFETKKIVENEIVVLRSKDIIKDVVLSLHLYAPIYESGFFRDRPLYYQSPVQLKLRNPENSDSYHKSDKVAFVYDAKLKSVMIEDQKYSLDTWIKNPNGGSDIMFVDNEIPVTEDTRLYYTLIDPSLVANIILGNLYVGAASKSSTVVSLSYLDGLPDRGNAILDQLIISYKNAAMENQNNLAANTLQFIEARIDEVQDELVGVEKELEKYRSSEGVINLSEQGNLYLANVGEYDRRIADINLQLSVLRKVENYVVSKNTNSGIVPSTLGIDDGILSQLLQRLYDAEIEYEQLRKTTATKSPILVAISNRIEKIRPSILENVRSQKANLLASRTNLTANSGKYNEALRVLPEQERKFVEISRKKKSVSDLYDFLVQKREVTALSYAPTVGNVRIIQNAEAAQNPVQPKKMFIYGLGLFLTFGAGLAWVAGKELLNSKILFRSELESRTNLPVLGELAFVDRPQNQLLITKHKDIFIADQFRQILTVLGLYDFKKTMQTLLITSSIPGEGKSYVSANLAQSIALTGKKTALVDLDLRKAGVSAIFGLEDKQGVKEFLTTDLVSIEIQHTDISGLVVFPSGKTTLHSTELLTQKKLATFFDTLKNEFDAIVIDSPPTTMVSDASLLASFCDQVLITVRHNHTPKFIANRIDEGVTQKRLNPAALIFNGVKSRGLIKQNYGYGYGYGYETAAIDKNESVINLILKKLDKLKKMILSIRFYKRK